MPPPPDDFPTPYNNHDDSSSTAGSNYGSSDPAWAPKEYIQKGRLMKDLNLSQRFVKPLHGAGQTHDCLDSSPALLSFMNTRVLLSS